MIDKCYFLNEFGKCVILKSKKCDGCKFYQTSEQIKESRSKANAMLRELSTTTQQGIAEKYYNGKKPWHKE